MGPEIRVTLFGRFSIQFGGEVILDQAPSKVQELLAYLILHRGRAHPREVLAELLWGESESIHSRKYLRQALWQLHAGLLAGGRERATRLIHQEPGWVELGLDPRVWVDTVVFEQAFDAVRGAPGLSASDASRVIAAVELYQGELLEGRCQGWCVYERDRFRQMYLTLLDKLVGYYQAKGLYEAGIGYGTLALQCDRARECTHRSLMGLRYLAGDRTGALRQYERCRSALREELDVAPCHETEELLRAIRNGDTSPPSERRPGPSRRGLPLFVLADHSPVGDADPARLSSRGSGRVRHARKSV
jgi:DNA-binding SARP family transcriptional activator